MANLEEIKWTIERQTGVPASLLTGETTEEIIASAKALLAFKREVDAERPRTAAEQFSNWINAREGIEQPDITGQALASIEEAARVSAGGYPQIKDGGEVMDMPDARPAREHFAEWLGQKTAFNPFKSEDGWIPMF